MSELIDKLKRSACAVYVAMDKGPAESVSILLLEAATEIERLQKELANHTPQVQASDPERTAFLMRSERRSLAEASKDILQPTDWSIKFSHINAIVQNAKEGKWKWMNNSRCKYLRILVDMRDGHCVLRDRHNEPITFAQLEYQLAVKSTQEK